MTTAVDVNTIPNLPGFGLKRRQKNYHRPQTFNVVNGVRVEHQEGVTFEKPKLVQVPKQVDKWRSGSLPESTTREEHRAQADHQHTNLPAWEALDRHVLRFYGYFKEAVVETNLENYRVRQAIILYYLEDDTCQIIEKKQDNSGIPQGQFLRRHRFPGMNGGYLTWQDLQVGENLFVYGRAIQLTGCDEFTRQFYHTQGVEQAPSEETEQDAFGKTMKQEVGPQGVPRTHERLYREVELGGGHVNKDMQQFLEYDRRVCRFFAVLDDLSLPQHERRPFVIHYFLADDTIEIREQYPLNSGRDNFPIFFRKDKMPRGAVDVRGPLDQCRQKDEYVNIQEFTVGQMHTFMGYHFYIYDADPFTRQYFREELGYELNECVDVRLPERTVPRPRTPQYNGYGSWDDSMGSVHQLIPKPPRRDYNKLFGNAGKVLRFSAQFVSPRAEDYDRLFVVNFDLSDDTLSIHEPPQRNLGIVTGKFLEKGVHTNQMTGNLFCPSDLYPGAVIKLYNHEFEIMDMDEYTRNHLENTGNNRKYDLAAVLEKIRESLRQQFPLVRDIFRRFDSDHDGVLTLAEFKKALEKWGFTPSQEEALVLMKHFDTRQDGQISYNEFCDVLLDEDYTTDMMKMKKPISQDFDPNYAQKAKLRLEERTETDKVRAAVRGIGDVIYKHVQTFQKLFKEFAHMTHERTITCDQILEGLRQIGHSFDIEDVRRTVLFVMPRVDLNSVDYVEFLKAMVASYHDVHATR